MCTLSKTGYSCKVSQGNDKLVKRFFGGSKSISDASRNVVFALFNQILTKQLTGLTDYSIRTGGEVRMIYLSFFSASIVEKII